MNEVMSENTRRMLVVETYLSRRLTTSETTIWAILISPPVRHGRAYSFWLENGTMNADESVGAYREPPPAPAMPRNTINCTIVLENPASRFPNMKTDMATAMAALRPKMSL